MGYIDKELLIRTYCGDWCDCDPEDCYMIPEEDGGLYCSHIETILSVPEADVKPVLFARWVFDTGDTCYCSNCGAEMRGE